MEEALRQLKEKFSQHDSEAEMIDLHASLGRCLAEDLYAAESLPSFRRSMVDGYAVIAADTLGASEQSPVILKSAGSVEIGKKAKMKSEPGHLVYIPTGGELPEGADAVVMIEHAERIGPDVAIYATATFGEHVVGIGEDVLEKTLIIKKGTRLSPQHGAILASLGYAEVPVKRKLKIAVLSTGDELVDMSSTPQHGQVRDCNTTIIKQIVEASGCEPVFSVRVADQMDELLSVLKGALASADVVLLSGGSSAGTKDMTQAAIDHLTGAAEIPNVFIHGLAIKPGKPTIIGKVDTKAVIGLPGHPAACFIVMKALVEPFLDYLVGKEESSVKAIPCVSGFQLNAAGGRDVYQLVELVYQKESLVAHILYGKSGMVSAMAKANAYVVIPMNQEGVRVGDALTAYFL